MFHLSCFIYNLPSIIFNLSHPFPSRHVIFSIMLFSLSLLPFLSWFHVFLFPILYNFQFVSRSRILWHSIGGWSRRPTKTLVSYLQSHLKHLSSAFFYVTFSTNKIHYVLIYIHKSSSSLLNPPLSSHLHPTLSLYYTVHSHLVAQANQVVSQLLDDSGGVSSNNPTRIVGN